MICFLGTSHAAATLLKAAIMKGLQVTSDVAAASLVFVSEDTPTNEHGERDLGRIRALVTEAFAATKAPIVVTSQVPPGFTRALGLPILCMAETLRMKDALDRALAPEQFIIGVPDPKEFQVPQVLFDYAWAHKDAKVLVMSYEEAEFAKIAINMFLAAQVECTNKLAAAASIVGARWAPIRDALRCDKRIGPDAYLTPGRWQDSLHLLRDHVTLESIFTR